MLLLLRILILCHVADSIALLAFISVTASPRFLIHFYNRRTWQSNAPFDSFHSLFFMLSTSHVVTRVLLPYWCGTRDERIFFIRFLSNRERIGEEIKSSRSVLFCSMSSSFCMMGNGGDGDEIIPASIIAATWGEWKRVLRIFPFKLYWFGAYNDVREFIGSLTMSSSSLFSPSSFSFLFSARP